MKFHIDSYLNKLFISEKNKTKNKFSENHA